MTEITYCGEVYNLPDFDKEISNRQMLVIKDIMKENTPENMGDVYYNGASIKVWPALLLDKGETKFNEATYKKRRDKILDAFPTEEDEKIVQKEVQSFLVGRGSSIQNGFLISLLKVVQSKAKATTELLKKETAV